MKIKTSLSKILILIQIELLNNSRVIINSIVFFIMANVLLYFISEKINFIFNSENYLLICSFMNLVFTNNIMNVMMKWRTIDFFYKRLKTLPIKSDYMYFSLLLLLYLYIFIMSILTILIFSIVINFSEIFDFIYNFIRIQIVFVILISTIFVIKINRLFFIMTIIIALLLITFIWYYEQLSLKNIIQLMLIIKGYKYSLFFSIIANLFIVFMGKQIYKKKQFREV